MGSGFCRVLVLTFKSGLGNNFCVGMKEKGLDKRKT